ncbi:LysE family translocator [Rhizobium calliandrae]|uniref:LysE family translocator n=1 Tax=Rhizobium calliandrae TaxID=1312182 RepID=A0ABT7KAB0_9HYPH|nr:LysE family translocator [Rhizobium calliandrae]MDL2405555.1 LysE family translocator [Rhizobium calliandrae]
MHAAALFAFIAVSFIGIATPGPTVLLALTNGSRFGVRGALAGMVGAVLSDFVLIGSVAIGLGALLAASEFWFSMLKWMGAAYLAFLGIMMLRSKGTIDGMLKANAEHAKGTVLSIWMKSFMVAVTNPKGYLFFSAFLPQFIDPSAPQMPQYAILALVFASLDFAIMFGYAVFGSQAVRFLKTEGTTLLERACGGALLALAGSLALYRRAAN